MLAQDRHQDGQPDGQSENIMPAAGCAAVMKTKIVDLNCLRFKNKPEA